MFNQLLGLSNYYFNPYAIPVMLVSILIFSIGFFVLSQNKRSIINVAFFCIGLSTGFWLFTIAFVYLSRTPQTAILWYRYFTFFGVINIMPSLLLFSTSWLGELKRKKYFLITNYAISLLFYGLAIGTDKLISPYNIRKYFWGYYPVYTLWTVPFLIFFLIQVIITVRDLYIAYKTEQIYIKRMSKKMILIASLIGFTAPVDFIPKLVDLPWLYPYGYISMLIYISMVAYAILKYRLMDIRVAITRTGIFVVVYTLVLGIPFSLSVFGRGWLIATFGQNWGLAPLILLTILATIGPFLYIYLQRRAEAIILRKQRAYQETLKQAARELARIHKSKKLLNLIVHIVTKTVGITHSAIYLLEEQSQQFILKATRNRKRGNLLIRINKENPLIEWLKNHKEILVYEEMHRKAYEGPAPILKELDNQMKSLDAAIIVPGFLKDKLLGFLILGHKRSGEFYTPQDLDTLSVIANQAALAIENAMLYENIEGQVRQRTRELVDVQKQLIQAEKLATVGTLAGGVAHEINNPLTAVLTNVQMLLADTAKLDSDSKESLELIEEATKRCRTIVQKLMTYAKKPLEAAAIAEINLLEVVEKAVGFLEYQLIQDNIKVITQAKEKEYPVRANFNEIEQVVTNLLLNARDAIRHVKKNGEIEISLRKTDDWVKLDVKDNGSGIPKEIMPKIFDPFFTTKDVGKGTGLGLSICNSIVEKHNGMITAQSEPGKGSTFTFQLPKAAMVKVSER